MTSFSTMKPFIHISLFVDAQNQLKKSIYIILKIFQDEDV